MLMRSWAKAARKQHVDHHVRLALDSHYARCGIVQPAPLQQCGGGRGGSGREVLTESLQLGQKLGLAATGESYQIVIVIDGAECCRDDSAANPPCLGSAGDLTESIDAGQRGENFEPVTFDLDRGEKAMTDRATDAQPLCKRSACLPAPRASGQ